MADMNHPDLKAMQTLIRLVSAGACKESAGDLCINWDAVMPLAAEQKVLSLVACAMLYSPKLDCPKELREYLLMHMRNESSVNLIRRQRIVHLLAEMKQAGIDAKVLKGFAVSECYAHPECRGSSDTDMLIDIRHEKQAVSFFEACGFQVDPRAATSHHTTCQHKKYGIVELHVALYAELIRDNWFREFKPEELVQEPAIVVDGAEGSFSTLGHTDQLIFLTLHMVKHFVLEGLTLRMMLDIALYFARHKSTIDTARYWATIERLHYDKLVGCILWNMIRFGGFQTSDFPGLPQEQPEQMPLILADLERGGYMGAKEKTERLNSGMEYNRLLMRKEKSELQYRLRMLGWKVKSGAKYMFPGVKMLRKLYPVTVRIPALMPVLWLWQLVSFPIKKICSGALKRDVRPENGKVTAVVSNRIDMFKKLDML